MITKFNEYIIEKSTFKDINLPEELYKNIYKIYGLDNSIVKHDTKITELDVEETKKSNKEVFFKEVSEQKSNLIFKLDNDWVLLRFIGSAYKHIILAYKLETGVEYAKVRDLSNCRTFLVNFFKDINRYNNVKLYKFQIERSFKEHKLKKYMDDLITEFIFKYNSSFISFYKNIYNDISKYLKEYINRDTDNIENYDKILTDLKNIKDQIELHNSPQLRNQIFYLMENIFKEKYIINIFAIIKDEITDEKLSKIDKEYIFKVVKNELFKSGLFTLNTITQKRMYKLINNDPSKYIKAKKDIFDEELLNSLKHLDDSNKFDLI